MIAVSVAKTGRLLNAAELLSVVLRTDCVPVPVTLELNVQSNENTDAEMVVGAELLLGDPAISITLIKVRPIKTQVIKDGRRIGGFACLGILSGCQRLIEPTNKAIILNDTSLIGAMRACGARMAAGDDIPLSKFVCLKGQIPTVEIAKRLQQESAVIMLQGGQLAAVKIDTLLKSEPIAKYDPSAVVWVDSPALQKLHRRSFVSVAPDGSTIENEGNQTGLAVAYMPQMDTRQLKNMEKVLIHRGSMLRPMDTRLQGGRVISIQSKPYLILTAAHRFDTGALGGNSVNATKIWLSSL
jgi:hypothetical protein